MKIVPSRPAGGRLAWSLSLRGPQASHPRKNDSPKGPPQPEKGVSGEETPPPSGGPGGSAPWCSFPCFLQRKQAPPRAVAPRRWHLQHPLPMVGKSLPLRTAHRFGQRRWSPPACPAAGNFPPKMTKKPSDRIRRFFALKFPYWGSLFRRRVILLLRFAAVFLCIRPRAAAWSTAFTADLYR